MSKNTYKAIFFDLDGTLLPMDLNVFLERYFTTLAEFAAEHGYEPKKMAEAVKYSVFAMMNHEPGVINADAFWSKFVQEWGPCGADISEFFDSFYKVAFEKIGAGCDAHPAAARVIDTLLGKGYPLYLTTMPLFPRVAVESRLRWAGVDPAAFKLITCYDNSTATKPRLDYYRENVARCGCKPEEILMVGNNTEEDLVAMELGLDAYLVTDYLIDPLNYNIDSVKHGSLLDFERFAKALPVCKGE